MLNDYIRIIYRGDIHALKTTLKSFNVRKITANHRDVYFELGDSVGLSYRLRTRELELFCPKEKRTNLKARLLRDLGLDGKELWEWAMKIAPLKIEHSESLSDKDADPAICKGVCAGFVRNLYIYSPEPDLVAIDTEDTDI